MEIPLSLREAAHFQAGVITRQQALRAGLSGSAITSKLGHGRWQTI